MKYRRIVNGDYDFGKNEGDFVTGATAVNTVIVTER